MIPLKLCLCSDRAQNLPEPVPHLAYTVSDFTKIGSLSSELLPAITTTGQKRCEV